MRFVSLLVFGVAIQISCYLFWAFDVFGGFLAYPIANGQTMQSVTNWFDISIFNTLIGIGGAVAIGLAGLLLRQGTYAVYAILLWGIGSFFPLVRDFFLAIPNTLAALIPSEASPAGFAVNPIMVAVSLIFAFSAYMFLFGLIFQREMT